MSVPLENPRCPGCDKFLFKKCGQKEKIETEDEATIFFTKLQRTIVINDILCSKCRIFQYKKEKLDVDFSIFGNDQSQSTSDDSSISVRLKPEVKESNIERIEVPIQKTISTHKYCCLYSATTNLSVIPVEVRMQSCIKTKIHLPVRNQCCRHHLIKNRFCDEDLGVLKVYFNSSSLSASELTEVMESLSIKCDSSLYDKIGDYSLSEKQLLVFTSCLYRPNMGKYYTLEGHDDFNAKQTDTITQALVVFLFKLHWQFKCNFGFHFTTRK